MNENIKMVFTYDEMMEIINNNGAKIISKSQKLNNNLHNKILVQYDNQYFMLCNSCDKFKRIDYFNNHKRNVDFMYKEETCRECKHEIQNNSYNNDYNRYLKARYQSLLDRSKKRNAECLSIDDFKIFAETNKDPVYNITLKESFENGMYDKLDVDHKIPISKGGSSLIDNLYLIPSEFNRLKLDKTLNEALAMIKLLYEKTEDIKQFYSNEEVNL